MNLSGKVGVITGGGGGLGRGICLVLADRGADIVVVDLALKAAEEVASEVAAKGRRSMALGLNVAEKKAVEKMVQEVLPRLGQIDILVNSVGVLGAPGFLDSPVRREEDWDATFQVNVRGVVLPSMVVAEHMKKRRTGKIVNIASGAGRIGRPNHPQYSASKAAVIN